jgi:putative aminopeptidase FrvX
MLSSRKSDRPMALEALLGAVLPIPTASYEEHRVLAYVRRFADERGLEHSEDAFGNVVVRYRKGRKRRPLVLQAHTDHPGFVVSGVRGKRLDLEFRGGLAVEYGKGEPLRVYGEGLPDGGAKARVTSVVASKAVRRGAPRRIVGAKAVLEGDGEVAIGDLALWDVEACLIRGELVHARQCDDLAGCVTVLATLDRVSAAGRDGDLIGLFTRAEEVGLEGAAAAAGAGTLPKDALVVAIETSSSAGGRAEQGEGGIIRVGDRGHIFSPRMTRWMTTLAEELVAESAGGARAFRYQRKLMDAGTTEATAFDLLGYETGAACLALGNWHNAGPKGRVRAETVHLGDLESLVRLCEAMVAGVPRFQSVVDGATKRWRGIAKEVGPRLRGSSTPS